jgi:alpha-galactosidase/6-phospho-beta-glucosidase family protein
VARQRERAETRGAELARWADRLADAYLAPGGPAMTAASDLLGRRRMTWYDDGVVPALAALAGQGSADLVLNVTGVLPEIAVELPCRVSGADLRPLPQPPLPAGPAALLARVAAYERAVLRLPPRPGIEALAEVSALHPLVPDEGCALRLARRMAARLPAQTCRAAVRAVGG